LERLAKSGTAAMLGTVLKGGKDPGGSWIARRRRAIVAARGTAEPRHDGGGADPYRAAMRHSRRVRFLRKAIPAFCAAAVIGPVAWGVAAPFARIGADIQVGPVSMSGTKLTMESPKLSGFKKDGKAYEVTATQATQDVKTPTIVELSKLTSRMEQDAKKYARLTADWGRFDQTADRLDLKGNVRVRTDNGYEADLLSARINVKSGDVVSDEPVVVRSQSGTITADRAEVRENGKHAVFEGRVRSVFNQDDPAAPVEASNKTKTQ
jgi:lipopolysaccharide export system protein LptC